MSTILYLKPSPSAPQPITYKSAVHLLGNYFLGVPDHATVDTLKTAQNLRSARSIRELADRLKNADRQGEIEFIEHVNVVEE